MYFCSVIATRFISVLVLWSFCFSLLHNSVVFVSFKLNQTFIAETLCENRQEPEMQCNGSCHLKKQLIQHDEQEPDAPREFRFDELSPSLLSDKMSSPCATRIEEAQLAVFPKSTPCTGYLSDVFHPPTV